jgi:hypothetical protein
MSSERSSPPSIPTHTEKKKSDNFVRRLICKHTIDGSTDFARLPINPISHELFIHLVHLRQYPFRASALWWEAQVPAQAGASWSEFGLYVHLGIRQFRLDFLLHGRKLQVKQNTVLREPSADVLNGVGKPSSAHVSPRLQRVPEEDVDEDNRPSVVINAPRMLQRFLGSLGVQNCPKSHQRYSPTVIVENRDLWQGPALRKLQTDQNRPAWQPAVSSQR